MKLHCKYFILLAGLSGTLHAGPDQGKADSLRKVLKAEKEDTGKVSTLIALAAELANTNYDSSIALSGKALTLAQHIGFKLGTAASYNATGAAQYYRGDYDNALDNYSKALSMCTLLEKNPGTSKPVAVQALRARVLSNLGNVYAERSDYPRAISYHRQALRVAEDMKDKYRMSVTYVNLGAVLHDQGNYAAALDNYLKGLRISEELNNHEVTAAIYGNIGNLYVNEKKFDLAFENLSKALHLSEEMGNKNRVALWLSNLGGLKAESHEWHASLGYLARAKKTYEELGNAHGVSTVISNMASVYSDQIESNPDPAQRAVAYQKALELFTQAMQEKQQLGDKAGTAIALGNIGTLYMKQKKFAEAKKDLGQALAISQDIGDRAEMMECYDKLAYMDSMQGNFREAYEHYKLFVQYKDSLSNSENTQRQTRLELQYAFDKKTAADSIRNAEQMKQEQLRNEQEVARQKTFTYGGALGFLMMLVIAGISFRAYRQKRKANDIISRQKNMVEAKQKEILDSIRYAKRIQQGIMPTEKYIGRTLKRLVKTK